MDEGVYKNYFSFRVIDSENEMLIREEPIIRGDALIGYKNFPIIDKKTFIECYNKWIKSDEENNK